MSDIFVSYSSADRDRVEPLANALRAEGWSVWWDRTIPAGQNYHEVIEAALAAARCVIVVWSAESIKSEWVRAEAEDGQQRHLLVPVRIDGAVPPLIFRQIQTADLRGWSGDTAAEPFRRLVDDVHALLGTVGAEPEPPPEPPSPNRRAWIIGGVAVATVIAVAVGIGRSGGPEPSPAGPADGGAHPAEAVAQERTRGSVCFTPATTFDLDDGRWNAPLQDADP